MEITNEIAADALGAMGNEARLSVIRELVRAPELNVNEIQKRIGVPLSTLNHHLERLYRDKLVNRRKEKQFIWYSLNWTQLNAVLNYVMQDCCCGRCTVEDGSACAC